ncbi:MAG: IMP dehydrogenase, partial [Puniceicoccales bacterium]
MSETIDTAFYKNADEFFRLHADTALTYDDVTLATRHSAVLPRNTNIETHLAPNLHLSLPIISADMDTVTEAPMAIAMASNGGLGLIHYNMSEREQVKHVARVKNNIHGLIQDPIKIGPDAYIADVLAIIDEKGYKFSTFPVVDDKGKLLGLLPGRVVKERYRDRKVAEAMTPRADVFTLSTNSIEGDPIGAADRFFNEHLGIHKLLVVDPEDRLHGLFTLSDIERINDEQRANVKPARDKEFRLICGAAVSAARTSEGGIDKDRFIGHVANLVAEGL